jgi:hypothetical protein
MRVAATFARFADSARSDSPTRGAQARADTLTRAAWYEHQQRKFEEAVQHPRDPISAIQQFPPEGWMAPAAGDAVK